MRLRTYIVRRLLGGILVLFLVSMLVFLLVRLIPGDPARLALGERASDQAVADLRTRLRLDRPLPLQYVYWISGVFRGDFGESLFSQRPVRVDLQLYFPATFELVLGALLVMTICGFVLGALAAYYKDTWVDNAIRFACYLWISAPSFAWGVFLLLLFSYQLNILPFIGRLSPGVAPPAHITGLYTIDSLLTGNVGAFWDALKHLVLPATALCMAGLAQNARITRASMSENISSNYIELGRLFNLPGRVLILKYLLRPSLIPPITLLGMEIGVLLSSAFVVELVFTWPGFARYGLRTILAKDLNAITIVVVIISAVYVISNILVDLATAYIDPRIRMRGKTN